MQPYFFPYIGYFSLIQSTDRWVVFDDIQYIRHGWINRNRILHPNPDKEWMYINVPIKKHHRYTNICDIKISYDQEWGKKILAKLKHYEKIAPYYDATIEIVKNCVDTKFTNISKLNTYCLEKVCNYIDIDFNYDLFSEININRENIRNSGDWALLISKKLKADEYINPIGGKELFSSKKFKNNDIRLKFLKMKEISYDQKRDTFIPNLSIIDILMFNSKDEIRKQITHYELKEKQ